MTTMTNQEWIEYYRFHPSEFESFIKFVESSFQKKDERIESLENLMEKVVAKFYGVADTASEYAVLDEVVMKLKER